MTEAQSVEFAEEKLGEHSPDYWIKKVDSTPLSIFVPQIIRFLHGQILLAKSRVFIKIAHDVAEAGEPHLAAALKNFSDSSSAKHLGMTFDSYFSCAHVILLVSEVEHFLGCAVSAVLRLYPEKMGGQSFKLSEVISASSTDELIDRAAKATLNSLMYEKPLDYIRKLSDILSIDFAELETYWPIFVELKARRDLGVHNNWTVNEIYMRKMREANIATNLAVGDRIVPTEEYVSGAYDSCAELVEKIATLLAQKWLPVPDESAPDGIKVGEGD